MKIRRMSFIAASAAFFISAIFFCAPLAQIFFVPKIADAVSSPGVNVQLYVEVCNSNLICEAMIGEDYLSCPVDCAPPSTSTPPTTGGGGGGGGGSGGGYTYPYPYGSTTPNTGPIITPNQPGGSTNTAQGTDKGYTTGGIIRPPGSLPPTGIDGIIRIAPYTRHATLNFKTYLASLLTISWGKTGTYEIGSSADSWYHQNFSKDITGLDPGTRYYYRLELIDSIGRRMQYEGQFITASERSRAPLPAIINFSVFTKKNSDASVLTWNMKPAYETILQDIRDRQQISFEQNYSENLSIENKKNAEKYSDNGENVAENSDENEMSDSEKLKAELKKEEKIYVRLTQSEYGYPQDPYEGKVVYEGSNEQATNIDLEEEKAYFYSIFTMNGKGEFSSPEVIRYIHKSKIGTDEEGNESSIKAQFDPLLHDPNAILIEKWTDPDKKTGFCGISESASPTLSLRDTFSGAPAEFKDKVSIQFIKDGQILRPILGIVNTDGREKLIIRAKSDLFDEKDRVGICLLSKKRGTYDNYLFSRNKDGTFELIFPAISSIYRGNQDYQFTMGMIKYSGEEMVLERGEISFFIPSDRQAITWFEMLLFIIILSVILWLGSKYNLYARKNSVQ